MKEMPLTRGLVALVDDADYEWLSQWKWSADRAGYAHRNAWDPARNKFRYVGMHRQLMGLDWGDKTMVDHVDGCPQNNQRSNLRLATRGQNMQNRKPVVTNTSGVKGVHWNKQRQKWQVYVSVHGKLRHIGLFPDIDEAIEVRQLAAAMVYGEFTHACDRIRA